MRSASDAASFVLGAPSCAVAQPISRAAERRPTDGQPATALMTSSTSSATWNIFSAAPGARESCQSTSSAVAASFSLSSPRPFTRVASSLHASWRSFHSFLPSFSTSPPSKSADVSSVSSSAGSPGSSGSDQAAAFELPPPAAFGFGAAAAALGAAAALARRPPSAPPPSAAPVPSPAAPAPSTAAPWAQRRRRRRRRWRAPPIEHLLR